MTSVVILAVGVLVLVVIGAVGVVVDVVTDRWRAR